MLFVPSLMICNFFSGTTRGDTSHVSWLFYAEGGVEEEVGLPVLIGRAIGGENHVQGGGIGCEEEVFVLLWSQGADFGDGCGGHLGVVAS